MKKSLKKKTICIIPARAGSTRIPGKNIKSFFGKPIIYYPIKSALNSNLFDKVIVSTDSKKIGRISKKFGAKIHRRNKKYADSYTDTQTVIKHVLEDLDKKKNYLKVCCVYPTSIFFTKKNLEDAIKKLKKKNNYVFSASSFNEPVDRSFYKKKDRINMFIEKNHRKRSQNLRTYYYDAAQFYLGWRKSWILKKRIFSGPNNFVLFENNNVQDIDNNIDWKLAKKKWKSRKLTRKL
tara:strand:+ start:849 stop:1556 length:708 start_codon:yes stop_codon:yes gene_type:complete